jgi:hypothetical protein
MREQRGGLLKGYSKCLYLLHLPECMGSTALEVLDFPATIIAYVAFVCTIGPNAGQYSET